MAGPRDRNCRGGIGVGAFIGPALLARVLAARPFWEWLDVVASALSAGLIVLALVVEYPEATRPSVDRRDPGVPRASVPDWRFADTSRHFGEDLVSGFGPDEGLRRFVGDREVIGDGRVTVTPQLQVEVSQRLRMDFENGRIYYPFHGTQLAIPRIGDLRPDQGLLRWHNDQVFRG
jgi:hypothetical protein